MDSNATATTTASSMNFRWKQAPLLDPGGIIVIGAALAVVVILTVILSFLWRKMKNQPEPKEHNAELPHDHQPPMPELPQRDFHTGEAATDCPVCLEEFVEGESLVELPTCLHAFHLACIQTWLTRNPASCPVCSLHIELQVDSVV